MKFRVYKIDVQPKYKLHPKGSEFGMILNPIGELFDEKEGAKKYLFEIKKADEVFTIIEEF